MCLEFPSPAHANVSSACLMRTHLIWSGLGANLLTSPGVPTHSAPRLNEARPPGQPLPGAQRASGPMREPGEASRFGDGHLTQWAVASVHRLTSGASGGQRLWGLCLSPTWQNIPCFQNLLSAETGKDPHGHWQREPGQGPRFPMDTWLSCHQGMHPCSPDAVNTLVPQGRSPSPEAAPCPPATCRLRRPIASASVVQLWARAG